MLSTTITPAMMRKQYGILALYNEDEKIGGRLADLFRRSSSTKYFSLHSTSVELIIRQLRDSGGMLSGFINAVSSGIHMDDPKP